MNPQVYDQLFVSSSVPDVHNVDLGAEGEWDLSEIPSSDEINVLSSFLEEIRVTSENSTEYSIEGPATAAVVFKLGLRSQNTFGRETENVCRCGQHASYHLLFQGNDTVAPASSFVLFSKVRVCFVRAWSVFGVFGDC